MNYYQLLVLRAERQRRYVDYMSSSRHKIGDDGFKEKLNAYNDSLNDYYRFKATTHFKRVISKGFKNTFKPFKSSTSFFDDLFFTHINTAKEFVLSLLQLPKAFWNLAKALNAARKKNNEAPQYAYRALRIFIQLLLSIIKIALFPLIILRALVIRPIITLRSRKKTYQENETVKALAHQTLDPKYGGRDRVYIALALKHHCGKAKKHDPKQFSHQDREIIEKPNFEKHTTTLLQAQTQLKFSDNALPTVNYSSNQFHFATMHTAEFNQYQLFFREKIESNQDFLRNVKGIGVKKNN